MKTSGAQDPKTALTRQDLGETYVSKDRTSTSPRALPRTPDESSVTHSPGDEPQDQAERATHRLRCCNIHRWHVYSEVARRPVTDEIGETVGYRVHKRCSRAGCEAESFGWRVIVDGTEKPGKPAGAVVQLVNDEDHQDHDEDHQDHADAAPVDPADAPDEIDLRDSVTVGRRVPGSPGWTYIPGTGVWRADGAVRVLEWCPTVTRHLVTRTARESITSRRVTIVVGGHEATVPMAEVADGTVWTDRFPFAVGTGERHVRDILRNIVEDQGARIGVISVAPAWVDGRLVLPPADCLPAGYGETAGTVEDFRAILRAAAEVPKLALVLGLAVGGLYVGPLGAQSFVTHLAGRGRQGKTTAQRMAAAVFGAPSDVVKPWNTTGNGVIVWLQGLSCLPGFRDELGASEMRAERLSSTVFRITQGACRDTSSRTQDHRDSRGSWQGTLISSGNESITAQIANEGIAARVVEIAPAFTLSAAHAEHLERLWRAGYGHGLAAIVERGPHPDAVDAWRPQIGEALDLPEGGVARTLGQSIGFGVAGARILGTLFDVPQLESAALDAGRSTLVELVAGLDERGASPGDRLLRAIESAMNARPYEWPTRGEYERAVTGAEGARLPREICGWDLTDDETPGDVAVITGQLRGIAEEAGIADPTVALKELALRVPPLLHRQGDGHHLARRIRVGSKTPRTYVIGGVCGSDERTCSDLQPPCSHLDQDHVPTCVPTSVPTADLGCSHCSHFSAEGGLRACACEDTHPPAPGAVPACLDCGEPVPTAVDDGIPVHPSCTPRCQQCRGTITPGRARLSRVCWACEAFPAAVDRTPPPPTEGTADPASPEKPSAGPDPALTAGDTRKGRPGRQRAAQGRTEPKRSRRLGVLAHDGGRWHLHSDAGVTELDAVSGTRRGIYALAGDHGLTTLTVHATAAAALGWPTEPPRGPRGTTVVPLDGWQTEGETRLSQYPAGEGLASFTDVWDSKLGRSESSVSVHIPALDDRARWYQAPDGATLYAALTIFARSWGDTWYWSPNVTASQMVTRRCRMLTAAKLPPPADRSTSEAMRRALTGIQSRPLTEDEEQRLYVWQWDTSAQHISAMCTGIFGNGEPVHVTAPVFDKKRAGYWRIRNLSGWHPLMPRLSLEDGSWAVTDTLKVLSEMGATFDIDEAWIYPDTGRYLYTAYQHFAKTWKELLASAESGEPGARIALKSIPYASFSGNLANRQGAREGSEELWRPDWNDAILAASDANLLRAAARIAKASGQYPVGMKTDALYYVSDEHKPGKAAPAGMRVGHQLGHMDDKGHVLLKAIFAEFGEDTMPAAFAAEWERKNR